MLKWLLVFLVIFSCSETFDVPNHTPGILKVRNSMLMVTYGEGGLVISNQLTGEAVTQIFPAGDMHSIDDFAVDGDLIFTLDARGRNYFTVYRFDGVEVEQVSKPIQVQGGPFNGIAANEGNLVISGGTTFLERFTYSKNGTVKGPIRFGRDRGHPDIILSDDGQAAFVSTDFGIGLDIDRFGIMSLHLGNGLQAPFVLSELGIESSGFTTGVTTPVGFPIQSKQVDNRLLVAHGGGLTVIELEQNSFANHQNLNLGISATAIDASESTAYLVGFVNEVPSLMQLDISNMENVIVVNTISLDIGTDIPTSIAVGESDIFIAAGSSGIISIPTQ